MDGMWYLAWLLDRFVLDSDSFVSVHLHDVPSRGLTS